jgi:hypothetical protein
MKLYICKEKPEALKALVDHELQHCCKTEDKQGNPVWYIQGHDVEDFVSVIRRNGLWSNALMAMHKVGSDFQQAELAFDKDKAQADLKGADVQVVVNPDQELKQAVGS